MNHNVTYCRVKGCRFAWSHLTCAHLCGTCGQKGHGQTECGKESLMARLRNITTLDTLPYHIYCQVDTCPDRSTHVTSAHNCHICHQFHAESDCQMARPSARRGARPRDRSASPVRHPQPLPPPQQLPSQSPLSLQPAAVQHSQPHPHPQLFVVNCPMCRKTNRIPSDQTRVIGIENRCAICWDKNSEIYMPNCGHICLCCECMETLHQVNQADDERVARDVLELRPGTNARHRAIVENLMGQEEGPIYIIVSAGMGCMWYFKRNGRDQPIDTFFMHADNWGQYGPHTDHRPQLNAFINGFRFYNHRTA